MTPHELTWFRLPEAADEAAIVKVEQALGIAFPADYRVFAQRFQGGSPRESDFALSDPRKTSGGVGTFLTMSLEGIDSVVGACAALSDRLPRRVIPVGEGGGGDYVCLDFRGAGPVPVVYWHHDRNDADELTEMAPTFTDFVAKLYLPDVGAEELLD